MCLSMATVWRWLLFHFFFLSLSASPKYIEGQPPNNISKDCRFGVDIQVTVHFNLSSFTVNDSFLINGSDIDQIEFYLNDLWNDLNLTEEVQMQSDLEYQYNEIN